MNSGISFFARIFIVVVCGLALFAADAAQAQTRGKPLKATRKTDYSALARIDGAGTSARECEVPTSGTVNAQSPVGFCDFYTRQLAYKAERQKLSEALAARAKNFAQPGIDARTKYEADLTAMREAEREAEARSSAAGGGPWSHLKPLQPVLKMAESGGDGTERKDPLYK